MAGCGPLRLDARLLPWTATGDALARRRLPEIPALRRPGRIRPSRCAAEDDHARQGAALDAAHPDLHPPFPPAPAPLPAPPEPRRVLDLRLRPPHHPRPLPRVRNTDPGPLTDAPAPA